MMLGVALELIVDLCKRRSSPSVSIYSSLEKAWPERKKNRIRIQNILRHLQQQCELLDVDYKEVEKWIGPLLKLLDETSVGAKHEDETALEGSAAEGLAFFGSKDFAMLNRVKTPFQDSIHLGNTFFVRPLLSLASPSETYFVLALSLKHLRLFEGSINHFKEVELNLLPEDIDVALGSDDKDRNLQFHARTSSLTGSGATYHGQGPPDDSQKNRITRFFNQVEKVVSNYLVRTKKPLILAGVDYLHPLYAQVNTYPKIVKEGLRKNIEELGEHELHEKTWEILQENYFSKHDLLAEFYEKASQQKILTHLHDIIIGSGHGRIDKLLVEQNADSLWGTLGESGKIRFDGDVQTKNSEELINKTICDTLAAGGSVHVLPKEKMPSETMLLAVTRF